MTERLRGVVGVLSAAIGDEPDHGNRDKLRRARELVRDVVWGTNATNLPTIEETRAAIREGGAEVDRLKTALPREW